MRLEASSLPSSSLPLLCELCVGERVGRREGLAPMALIAESFFH